MWFNLSNDNNNNNHHLYINDLLFVLKFKVILCFGGSCRGILPTVCVCVGSYGVSVTCHINSIVVDIGLSEALSEDDTRTKFIVIVPSGYPHLLECGQGAEYGATEPRGVLHIA